MQEAVRRAVVLAAIVLGVAGGAIRLIHLDQPLLDFHATRQYRSALLARACYYDRGAPVSEAARTVAAANRAMQPAGEPPLMEWLACAAYVTLGEERLAIPRAAAAGIWLLGAIPLFLIARRLQAGAGAAVAVAVYVFLPYAIVASRAFQPDPLMTTCALWAVLAVARGHEQPSLRRVLVAAAGIAVAALVKPMSVFFTLPAAFAAAGSPGTWRQVRVWAPIALGLAPAVLYYGYEAIAGTLARDQLRLRFVPSLLATPFFWDGLAQQISRVFGWPLFAAAAAATLIAPSGRTRRTLCALWFGYAAFAVAFTYHVPTHDYYHLPFVALVALAIGVLAGRIRSTAATLAVAAAFAAWGAAMAWPRLAVDDGGRVADAEAIGTLTGHTARALFLDTAYGYPLMYHGEISGDAWPNRDDLAAEAFGGARPLDAAARFARDYSYGVTHFVVTDLGSLAAQPDLQQFLAAHARVVRQESRFHVYAFSR